jgi:ubiquinone/menaquinone biosynthesis C-methylase UbiE
MNTSDYIMESDDETVRLDLKTDPMVVEKQALWAGIKPGMRVADLGFGSGKTTYRLHQLVRPVGQTVGLDRSAERIRYAKMHYADRGIDYIQRDIQNQLTDLGMFDFIYVRFVLEYYNQSAFDIVKNISGILKSGGVLNLIDLDHNCLNHYGLSERLEKTFFEIMEVLKDKADFDPFAGRKLYAHLYDLGYEQIKVDLTPHHLIYSDLNEIDAFNWMKKAQVAVKQLGYRFDRYNGCFDSFYEEFMAFFTDPRRFTYTPLILCRGQKP